MFDRFEDKNSEPSRHSQFLFSNHVNIAFAQLHSTSAFTNWTNSMRSFNMFLVDDFCPKDIRQMALFNSCPNDIKDLGF